MDEPKYTLVEHIDEFRLRLIYCLISFGIFSALSWRFVPFILKFISSPVPEFVFLSPAEAFFSYLKVTLWSGFFLSFPIIIYNLLKFISPALTPRETKFMVIFLPSSFFLFLLGFSFAFFLAIPLAIKFLVGFGSGVARPMLSISEYISFFGALLLAFGLMFELPLAIILMVKLNVITVSILKKHRKHSILFIFVAAAIITPTPDAFTQFMLAIPLIILYEIGIFMSKYA